MDLWLDSIVIWPVAHQVVIANHSHHIMGCVSREEFAAVKEENERLRGMLQTLSSRMELLERSEDSNSFSRDTTLASPILPTSPLGSHHSRSPDHVLKTQDSAFGPSFSPSSSSLLTAASALENSRAYTDRSILAFGRALSTELNLAIHKVDTDLTSFQIEESARVDKLHNTLEQRRAEIEQTMAEMRKEMERMCAEVARIDARSQEQSLPLPHSAPALEPSPPRPPPLSSLPSLADEREDISSQITSALPEAKFYTDSARIDLSEEMDASLSTHFTHFNKVDEELQSLGKHLRAMGEEMGGMREEAGRKWEEMLAKVRGVLEVSRACVGLLTRLDPEVQSGTAAAENVERPAGQVQDDHEGQGMILDQA